MLAKSITLLLASATAVFGQSALVVVETSHHGAGSDLTNTSLTVPLNSVFTSSALQQVTTLYLTGAEDIDTSRISCTPHLYTNGTGNAGLAFSKDTPSNIATNPVSIGSLVCVASPLPGASPSTSITGSVSSSGIPLTVSSSLSTISSTTAVFSNTSSTSVTSTSSTSSTNQRTSSSTTSRPQQTSTSIFVTTITQSSESNAPGITITSTAPYVPPTTTLTTTPSPSTASSSPPSLNTEGAGVRNVAARWAVAAGGLAALLQ